MEGIKFNYICLYWYLQICSQPLKLYFILRVGRLQVGDLDAVGWGKGPWALVAPVKAIRVGSWIKTLFCASVIISI